MQRDLDLIPGLGKSTREGNSNLLQYSCLENSMDREAWQATEYWGRKELDITEHSSLFQIIYPSLFPYMPVTWPTLHYINTSLSCKVDIITPILYRKNLRHKSEWTLIDCSRLSFGDSIPVSFGGTPLFLMVILVGLSAKAPWLPLAKRWSCDLHWTSASPRTLSTEGRGGRDLELTA